MIKVIQGDALAVLRTLPADSVNCCVTSPPYLGLRDYGVAGQLGLEPTPEEYVAKMVEVFAEVRRVLRDDGTLWINLGDCYAAGGKGGGGSYMAERKEAAWQKQSSLNGWKSAPRGFKPKDLVGIPWRVAFALQAAGWYLRSDIIWHKPNPMPESVTDRPTKAHEYLFLLSKSKRYYYDAEAIKEECSPATHARVSQNLADQIGSFRANGGGKTNGPMKAVVAGSTRKLAEAGSGIKANKSFETACVLEVEKRNKRSVWTVSTEAYDGAHFAVFPPKLIEPCILAGCPEGGRVLDPFAGSGTTLEVAGRLGRHAIGIELNPAYIPLIDKRVAQWRDQVNLFEAVNE
jgi:DNA modification methylase